VLDLIGERGRNRTFNLLIKSQLLCQLSYAPESYRGEDITILTCGLSRGICTGTSS
jgi:hypothetical protein